MNWEDKCYLLSKRKFRENANIINVFSQTKGKVSGVVYGGNSRKIRKLLTFNNYKLIGRLNWLDQIYFKKHSFNNSS